MYYLTIYYLQFMYHLVDVLFSSIKIVNLKE